MFCFVLFHVSGLKKRFLRKSGTYHTNQAVSTKSSCFHRQESDQLVRCHPTLQLVQKVQPKAADFSYGNRTRLFIRYI